MAKRSMIRGAVAVAVAITAATTGAPHASVAEAATAAFKAVRPCRLADTRTPTGFTRIDASTIRIAVGGRCGLSDASTAAALTVTITEAEAPGFATVYPTGTARPMTTSGNVQAGETRATSTIARIGAGTSVDVYLSMKAQLVVDVTGSFVPAATATSGRFVPFGPLRLADTRLSASRLPAGGRLLVPLTAGIPTDAVAVAVNVTITGTEGAGFATAYPGGDVLPPTSTVNSDRAGQTRSATVIVAVSTSGFSVYASSPTDVVVDVFGYFTGPSTQASSTGLFTAIDPLRVLDTRETSPLGTGVPLYADGGMEVQLPGDLAIAAYMVTAVDAAPGFVTAFPAGTARPGAANATISVAGETVANLSFTQRSNRGVAFYSLAKAHLVVDLAGWFSGITRTATMPAPANVAPTTSVPGAAMPLTAAPATGIPATGEFLPRGETGCTADIEVAAPKANAERIGTSVQGGPILAEHYGDPNGKPVLVVGPAHGDECSALAVVEAVRARARAGDLPKGVHLVVIPTLNPDGLAAGTRRNANGVDLNRDGVDRSQPETVALMTYTAALRPIASVHLHSPLSTVGGQGGPFELGKFIAAHIAEVTGIHLNRTAGAETYFLWGGQAQVLPTMAAVLVETPRGFASEAIGASGDVMAGPPGSSDLWQLTATAILESFTLV